VPEPNETFRLNVTNIVGGTANNPGDPFDTTKTYAIGTVLNNDVKISMRDDGQKENASFFLVKMSVQGANAINSNGLQVKLIGNTGDGTATVAGGDYKEVTDKSINVVGGASNEQVATHVDILNQAIGEYCYFDVTLDAENTSMNAEVVIADSSAKLTIIPDE
jgi:hypothetical protein